MVDYVHYHNHKRADHPQFDYQCPNEVCEHYFGKKPSASPASKVPAQDRDNKARPAETYKQRTVRIMYNDGRLDCGNERHYRLTSKPGDQYKTPTSLPPKEIVEAMKIGVDAQCACERKAIKEAWGWNRAGVFETEWVTPGAFHKGYGKYEPSFTPRRVMPLHFNPTKADVEHLHAKHPGWLFVAVSGGLHDHGVAHATAQIGSYNLLHGLPRGRWLDLHGNPTANEAFNAESNGRTMETLVNIESSKDVLRSRTKWGQEKAGNRTRYHVGALRDLHRDKRELLESVEGCVSIHTLYYYEPSEIPAFLSLTKNKTMWAMLHRFEGESGTMNNGEQTWKRIRRPNTQDWIEQTNVKTKEVYTHPDPEKWFTNHSWTPCRDLGRLAEDGTYNQENSLAWDGTLCADGTYMVTITTCTPKQALLDASYKAPIETAVVKNSEEYVERYGSVQLNVGIGMETVVIPPSCVELFRESRRRMIGSTRNTDKYRSHCQYVATKSKSIVSGDANIHDIQAVYDVAFASFWVDAGKEQRKVLAAGSDMARVTIDTIILGLNAKNFKHGVAELLHLLRTYV
jgi:hypothetical protein